MDIWLSWLGAVLNLDQKSLLPCSLPRTGEGLLPAGCGAATYREQNYFAAWDVEPSRNFSKANSGVSAHLYVTLGSHLYVNYNALQKELLKEAFLMAEVELSTTSVYVGRGYLQHAGSHWCRNCHIRYNSYRTPESHDLPDALAVANRHRIFLGSKEQ